MFLFVYEVLIGMLENALKYSRIEKSGVFEDKENEMKFVSAFLKKGLEDGYGRITFIASVVFAVSAGGKQFRFLNLAKISGIPNSNLGVGSATLEGDSYDCLGNCICTISCQRLHVKELSKWSEGCLNVSP